MGIYIYYSLLLSMSYKLSIHQGACQDSGKALTIFALLLQKD
jgi:hypothetical protein